jgi:hypothetical protein
MPRNLKLITMSVWGSDLMYWEGAVANAQLYWRVYPGWDLRVYTDTQNKFTVQIADQGADVRLMSNQGGFYGAFWRFLPVSEPDIDALIVRDADSRLNAREAAAVAEWLASGKRGHVMRDHFHHTNVRYPIMGGMWGIRGGVIDDIEQKVAAWGRWRSKEEDLDFLRETIWPAISGDCLLHTRSPETFGGVPFPPHPPIDSDYVGQVYYAGHRKDSSRPL